MEFTKINTYIERIDSLIRRECTGTADDFAQKIGVSKRTLKNHLQQLREIGIEVIYDRFKKTYKYPCKGRIFFGFNPDGMSQIKGGTVFIHNLSLRNGTLPNQSFLPPHKYAVKHIYFRKSARGLHSWSLALPLKNI